MIGGFLGQYVYARKLARAAYRDAQLERLRQDRIKTYSDFVGALIEFRRTQLGRWFAEHGASPDDPDGTPARDAGRAQRATALEHYYRVALLADDEEVVEAAALRSNEPTRSTRRRRRK